MSQFSANGNRTEAIDDQVHYEGGLSQASRGIDCCGDERDTPFCPMCGKQLRSSSPLNDLIRHVARELTCRVKKRDRLRSQAVRSPSKERTLNLLEASVVKWEAWLNELTRLRGLAESCKDR